MQLGAVLVFDAAPLSLRHGGLDVERLRAEVARRLPELPRARERRVRRVLGSLATFAPDPAFQLEYHVRHASLPRPGDERALKRLAARVFSQALDPEKPLWELWAVEGLDANRFALIAKCDSALLAPGASVRGSAIAAGAELLRDAAAAVEPARLIARASLGARRALDAAEDWLVAADSPGADGPETAHRRIDWLGLACADVAAVRARLGGSERDVVLAALCGGLRRLQERRGARVELGALRVVTPSGVGETAAAQRFRLPVDVHDARARLVALRAASERFAPAAAPCESPLHELAAQAELAATRRADVAALELAGFATVPALLGARLQAFVPVPPGQPGRALSVTLLALGERLFVSLASDAARVPDLAPLCDATAAAFDELRRLAAEPAGATATRRSRASRRRSREKAREAEA